MEGGGNLETLPIKLSGSESVFWNDADEMHAR